MSSPRILYIEDNPANRMLVQRVLLAEDIEVVEAEDAMIGIDLAMREKPDLILMDLQLPSMDGLTATRHLRAIDSLKDVPIIALTANVMKEDIEKARAAGCNGFIGKPIDIDVLPREIKKHLRSRG
ncbi:MAG: response regulator [Anaerolineae bacterium]|nr:response regulator [Anaerolineae bacterium]